MFNIKREKGLALRHLLKEKFDSKKIAHWAGDYYTLEDRDASNVLQSLNLMDEPGFSPFEKEELEYLANLLILDVKNVEERFLPMAPEHGYLFYDVKADLAIGKWYILLIPANLTKQQLLDELAIGLQLPGQFCKEGKYEWSKALEWFVDLSWISESAILLVHEDIPLQNDPNEQIKYFELLSDIHTAWYEDELDVSPAHIVYYAFPKKYRDEILRLKDDSA